MMAWFNDRAVVEELHRLEAAGYVGLLGVKYLSENLATPDADGNRVTFISLAIPAEGWAIVAFGPDGEEQKYKFLRDVDNGWVYDGVEKAETLH